QAIDWFNLDAVGRSASRFDFAKLESLNGHYIRNTDDARLAELVIEKLSADANVTLAQGAATRVKMGMPGLKERAKNINELSENAKFYAISRPLEFNDKARQILEQDGRATLGAFLPTLKASDAWTEDHLHEL